MRIAIIGGGIAGLTAAWQLRQLHTAGPLHVSLFESSSRLGGIIDTVREGGFVVEAGPDAWLTAKPWASELARELGLESELIPSNDAARKTWLYLDERLLPMPEGMNLIVPSDLDALTGSPLFSDAAMDAYRREPDRAAELLASIPAEDESVASFTLRHFGPEVLERIAAPLLSGVFGGDAHRLSARAALPALVAMERSHGSLIHALKLQATRRSAAQTGSIATDNADRSLFTTLRSGVGTLVDRITSQIPPAWIHLNTTVHSIAHRPAAIAQQPMPGPWLVTHSAGGRRTTASFDRIFLAAPTHVARALLAPLDATAAELLPIEASSAVLVAFAFPDAARVPIPAGFGLLVPPATNGTGTNTLLQACTFADQKFPYRVPPGARLLRAFFGGAAATRLAACNNDEIAAIARLELARVLHAHTHGAAPLSGPTPAPLPDPLITVVRRLPHSLPQYTVGHLDRAAEFTARLAAHLPGLTLLGNSLHGLGIPDVIRDARRAAIETITQQPTR